MLAIRIDGGGAYHDNERIIAVSKILESIPFKNDILKITDIKGNLIVLWDTNPLKVESELVDSIWFMFDEYLTEHKITSI